MCLGRSVYYCVGMSLSAERLGHICTGEEKLEFKRGEDSLGEVEKFCYLGAMISCYVGASEAVSAKSDSIWEKVK